MKLHTINPNGNLETINKVKLSLGFIVCNFIKILHFKQECF